MTLTVLVNASSGVREKTLPQSGAFPPGKIPHLATWSVIYGVQETVMGPTIPRPAGNILLLMLQLCPLPLGRLHSGERRVKLRTHISLESVPQDPETLALVADQLGPDVIAHPGSLDTKKPARYRVKR